MSRVAVYGYAGSVGFVRGVLLFAAAFALRLVRHLLFGIGLTAIGLILLKPAAAAPDSPDAGSRAIATDRPPSCFKVLSAAACSLMRFRQMQCGKL